jgi:putative transposase
VIAYIDAHRGEFGVEPICRALQFAPRTYYAAKARFSSSVTEPVTGAAELRLSSSSGSATKS